MHEILVKHRVRIEEAKAASLLLLESPPRFKADHVKAFLACVYRGRDSNQSPRPGLQRTEPSDCKQCFGSGFVTVLHPKPDLWIVDELGYKRWRNPKALYTCAVRCDCQNGPPSQTLGIIEYERSFPTLQHQQRRKRRQPFPLVRRFHLLMRLLFVVRLS